MPPMFLAPFPWRRLFASFSFGLIEPRDVVDMHRPDGFALSLFFRVGEFIFTFCNDWSSFQRDCPQPSRVCFTGLLIA